MKREINIKNQCLLLVNYFIKINYGGSGATSVWKWDKEFVEKTGMENTFKKRQVLCIYSDLLEGIRHFKDEQLKDFLAFCQENNGEFSLGKGKDWRVINFFLKERIINSVYEFEVLTKLFNDYKEDSKMKSDKKKEIEFLLENWTKDNKI